MNYIRSRSIQNNKPSFLRPNKHIRISPDKYHELRQQKWEEQNHRCANPNCQRYVTLEQMELDHEPKRSHGGLDIPEHVRGFCGRCHRKRHVPEKVVPRKPNAERQSA